MKGVISILIVFFLFSSQVQAESDTSLIRRHLTALSIGDEYSTYTNVRWLNTVAKYIRTEFEKYSADVSIQEFTVEGNTYHNIICTFGIEHDERIIIGAHYDVCDDQAGADDNASGVTGILELARMLNGQQLNYRIDLVAFTLEEPPFS